MATVVVTDATDPRLGDFLGLTDARLRRALEPELGLFMAEGERIIGRALAAGFRLRTVLTEQRWLAGLWPLLEPLDGVDVLVVEPDELRDVTGYQVHRGALATFERRPLPAPAELLRGAAGSPCWRGWSTRPTSARCSGLRPPWAWTRSCSTRAARTRSTAAP